MGDLATHQSSKSAPPKHENQIQFLCRAIFITIVLVVIPLIPSQAPDFFNQTLHTRSWELLQLVLVGIAVSYGLFSKRNDGDRGGEKEDCRLKAENAQSYVTRLLDVSPVFDDDEEDDEAGNRTAAAAFGDNRPRPKVEAWSSKYHRNEALVSNVSKPLLLPVRSLKSPANSEGGSNGSSKSSWGSKEEKLMNEDKVVLPSPIPWRSRSARILEVKRDGDVEESPRSVKGSPVLFRSQSSRAPNSLPRDLSPLASEDVVRRRASYKPSSHPPPPPPPPPMEFIGHKSKATLSWGSGLRNVSESVRTSHPFIGEKINEDRESISLSGRRTAKRDDVVETKKEEKMESDDEDMDLVTGSKAAGPVSDPDTVEFVGENSKSVTSGNIDEEEAPSAAADVDKKAEEFIAKFREQIRLQRIQSIRRSTTQAATSHLS